MSEKIWLGGKYGSIIGNYAIVDDEDYENIIKYSWYLKISKTRKYAIARIDGKLMRMHRYILGITNKKQDIDHINNNGLDNRKCNLRLCNRSQNNINSKIRINKKSKYKGVTYRPYQSPKYPWQARISYNKTHFNLGYYTDEDTAGHIYDIAVIKLYGEFARLNFTDFHYNNFDYTKVDKAYRSTTSNNINDLDYIMGL